jgi:hypothetical protein
MIIERTKDEIILRIPLCINFEEVQSVIDLMTCKETTALSEVTRQDVDEIARETKKGWWQANNERFIRKYKNILLWQSF